MYLLVSIVLFVTMFVNVVLGTLGLSVFLTDVQEMLVLLLATVFFVVDILKREARAKDLVQK